MAKKPKPMSFRQRLQTWAINADPNVKDTVLLEAADLAWRLYTQKWPRTASLVLSAAFTLHQLNTTDDAIIDTHALAKSLKMDSLHLAMLQALLCETKIPNLAWVISSKIGRGHATIHVVLGVVLLLNVADAKYNYDDVAEALKQLPVYFNSRVDII